MLRRPFPALGMLQIPRTQQRLAKPQQDVQSKLMLRPCEFPFLTSVMGRQLSAGISIYIGRNIQG